MLKGYILICRNAEGVHGKRKIGNPWNKGYRMLQLRFVVFVASSRSTCLSNKNLEYETQHCNKCAQCLRKSTISHQQHSTLLFFGSNPRQKKQSSFWERCDKPKKTFIYKQNRKRRTQQSMKPETAQFEAARRELHTSDMTFNNELTRARKKTRRKIARRGEALSPKLIGCRRFRANGFKK